MARSPTPLHFATLGLGAGLLGAAGPIGPAIDSGDWGAAMQDARALPDPIAPKLVTYLRLLRPGQASATEIAAFMAASPDWPGQPILAARLAVALTTERDDAAVLAICRSQPPRAAPSLLRCADAQDASGEAGAAASARLAWVQGIHDPSAEAGFLKHWGGRLTAEDQWRRFDRLAWAGDPAAARQLRRLDPAHARLGAARLAFRHDDPHALSFLAAVPASLRGDPTLLLEQARFLRRQNEDNVARDLWRASAIAAEAAAPPDRRPAFWTERQTLAHHLLLTGDAPGAFALADDTQATGVDRAASLAFAGWLALSRLHDPRLALQRLTVLEAQAHSAITRARAAYWVARADAALHDDAGAHAAYSRAAAWPTTYYGQLAARALGDGDAALAGRLRAASDTQWSAPRGLAFAQGELARAVLLLVAWGHKADARPFLAALDRQATDATGRALAAQMAIGVGLPDMAVRIARRAGHEGIMLPVTGWPAAEQPPAGVLPAPLALAVMRQESSFDPDAVSGAGAVGLMQVRPGTADGEARALGDQPGPVVLTDPATNMRLGGFYLRALLDRFGGVLPYAIAAYDAGPARVRDWIAANGDPAATGGDMIDWIEAIPFSETRDYVQRVVENLVVYRLQAGGAAGSQDALLRWVPSDGAGGHHS